MPRHFIVVVVVVAVVVCRFCSCCVAQSDLFFRFSK